MPKQIIVVGNSIGVTLPKSLEKFNGWCVGTKIVFEYDMKKDEITIKKAKGEK